MAIQRVHGSPAYDGSYERIDLIESTKPQPEPPSDPWWSAGDGVDLPADPGTQGPVGGGAGVSAPTNTPDPIPTGDVQPTPEELAEAKARFAEAQAKKEEAARLRDLAKDGTLLPQPTPKDVNVSENMRLAREHRGDFVWFYNMVKSGGPWDYKSGNPHFEDFGNFHFGAVARAFGFPEEIAKRGAGWYQERSGTSHPNWGTFSDPSGSSYGDDPVDQFWIEMGSKIFELSGGPTGTASAD